MKTYLQVFSGGFGNQIVDLDKLLEKVDYISKHVNINGIIMGWTVNKKLYNDLKKKLNLKGIELYFWLPVFSELDYFEKFQNVIDYKGDEIKSEGFQEGENFNFYCPNNRKNIENIKSIFLNNFLDYDIDGIFLDKIRYPAFSNGIKSIFTCFCEICQKKMQENGIDVDKLKLKINNILEIKNESDLNPLNINKYKDYQFEFLDDEVDKFFKFKERTINESLEELINFFKSKGLKIGLDLFAPHLSYFTGQNILKLHKLADFVKPMYYRATHAPAGIPFEIEMYSKSFIVEDYEKIKKVFLEIIGENEMDISDKYMENELLDLVSKFGIENIAAGLEFNKIENIALSNKEYLSSSIDSFYNSGIDGIVLSWDLMKMPLEHIEVYIEKYKRDNV